MQTIRDTIDVPAPTAGVLVPLVSLVLDDTRIGFAHMNQAIKRRAVTAPPPATT